jgi:hypothetical protein
MVLSHGNPPFPAIFKLIRKIPQFNIFYLNLVTESGCCPKILPLKFNLAFVNQEDSSIFAVLLGNNRLPI